MGLMGAQTKGTAASGHSALLQALEAITGEGHVLTGPGLQAYEQDWRRRWHGRALAVVRPGNTDQVAQVVRACAEHGVSIVPQGGHTGLVGGGTPDDSGTQVVMSLQRMNRVREIDADNLTLTAAVSFMQRGEHANDAVKCGQGVANAHANPDRWPVGLAAQMAQATHGLGHHAKPRFVAVRPRLSVA